MSPPPRYESKAVDASPLGQPLHFAFANRSAPNRFLKAAMTERLSSWSSDNLDARGIPSKQLINVYRRWGEGQIGQIQTGNIMIEPDQLEAAGNPIIPRSAPFSGERFDAFREMASVSKAHGSIVVGQVSHPGRQVEDRIQPHPISASDVQLEGNVMGMSFAKPRPASHDDISAIVDGFAHAAEYLDKAGYDGIELHAAHGYLLAQFLSNTTNKRTDAYGGDIAARSRLIVEIAREIRRRASPSFILGIKMNSKEFQEGGITEDEARQVCAILERERFDYVELSGGTYESLAFTHKRESTRAREAFFLEFADSIVKDLKQTKAYVTGGFKTVGAMVDALGTVDGVGLARPLTQEPDLCKDILAGRVTGAIRQRFDENDFGMTNVVAGTQIRQMSKEQEPMDGSSEENVEAFQKDMQTWMQGLQSDKKMEKYGYIDLQEVKAVPYGTAAAS